jgi:hypothetical protein
MSEVALSPSEAPLLSPVQRLVNIFVAPTKTFEDIRRRSGWWVPFLIAALISGLYGFVIVNKVGMTTLVDETIRQSVRTQDQLANATPQDAAKIRSIMGISIKTALYLSPLLVLIFGLINAGVLLATANFGAGGRAKYTEMLSAWYYAAMPLTVFSLLVVGAIYGGVVGDSFNLKNPIGTNIGFYLTGSDLPKMIIPILSAIDLFAIWVAVLLTIGVSTVAGIKRGAAAAIVFGWWFVFVLFQVAGAAFNG